MTQFEWPDEQDLIALNALADGELGEAEAMTLRQRIKSDPALQHAFDRIIASKAAVSQLDRPAVSAAFRQRIAQITAAEAPAKAAPIRAIPFAAWRAVATSSLLAASLAGVATYAVMLQSQGLSMPEIVASTHRRSLISGNPVDILSSDRHTVKPWLDAKLGLSPPAVDLTASGYPLLGGRIEVIGTQPIPALAYKHDEHLITLLAQPGTTANSASQGFAYGGFNMVRWRAVGFDFWAISDLEPAKLDEFVQQFRAATETERLGAGQ